MDPEYHAGRHPLIIPSSDIELILATGELPDGDLVGGAMRAVVRNTSQLTREDRAAMANYLKSLPPIAGAEALTAPRHAAVRLRLERLCGETAATSAPLLLGASGLGGAPSAERRVGMINWQPHR